MSVHLFVFLIYLGMFLVILEALREEFKVDSSDRRGPLLPAFLFALFWPIIFPVMLVWEWFETRSFKGPR